MEKHLIKIDSAHKEAAIYVAAHIYINVCFYTIEHNPNLLLMEIEAPTDIVFHFGRMVQLRIEMFAINS